MPLVIPVAGAEVQLDILLKKTLAAGGGEYHLGLYTNDYTPDRTSVFADFTEAAYTDYERIFLERAEWGDIESDLEDRAKVTYGVDPVVFEMGDPPSAVTAYGHFVIDETTDTVIWAERWDAPRTMTAVGDKIEITVIFTYTYEGNPP